jgi:archaellum biogenesis protein FlaJ (TadC family)
LIFWVRNFTILAAFTPKGVFAMRIKMTLLAIAYVAVSGLLLAVSYRPQEPVAAQKTDRLAGSSFLVERFAG